ncbi:hypothetical protein M427DRAFT_145347 [Gonapodya prolifera JEL478]|uniref:Uncharacterized protein n=1 Tax=Gonapodya prolifera (strain JEL478) TaxID=1344416 RepID=A0A139AHC9_GONPJ|nr:hypothetical protein M427DRAFT_145347 [Gonapodya prolifera JEL478]|eukprot:KXS15845.1 hypothetical protein M427DRAFT_145347 [Gonapodya prolifera JEL478]
MGSAHAVAIAITLVLEILEKSIDCVMSSISTNVVHGCRYLDLENLGTLLVEEFTRRAYKPKWNTESSLESLDVLDCTSGGRHKNEQWAQILSCLEQMYPNVKLKPRPCQRCRGDVAATHDSEGVQREISKNSAALGLAACMCWKCLDSSICNICDTVVESPTAAESTRVECCGWKHDFAICATHRDDLPLVQRCAEPFCSAYLCQIVALIEVDVREARIRRKNWMWSKL